MSELVKSRGGRVGRALAVGLLLTPVGCSAEGQEDSGSKASGAYAAVYYQPRVGDLRDPDSLIVPSGVLTLVAEPGKANSWTIGNCQPGKANFFERPGAKGVTTVGGFSLGRVGLGYLLSTTTPDQQRQIDYGILFDPANGEDVQDSCDPPNTPDLIKNWLELNPDKRLVVFAGQHSAEGDFAGVRWMLSAVAGTAMSGQVTICVTGMGHEETWNSTKHFMTEPPITSPAGCPTDPQTGVQMPGFHP